jgi:hypothetical protein
VIILQRQILITQKTKKLFIAFSMKKAFAVMKKTPAKKLSLGKITIASLSKANQKSIKGGLPRDFTKVSVCADQCCGSDINAQCRTI